MATQLQNLFPNGIKIYTPENQASSPTDYLLYLQNSDAPFKNNRVIQNHLAWTRQKIFFIHSDQVPTFSSAGMENAPIRKKYRRNPQCDYFIDEMVESLSNHIHPDQLIKHAWINELYVPLLIKPADIDSVPIAIILDGIADRRGGLALNWEKKHRALLKFYGLEYVYVWSSNWWKNESEAVSNLINKIEKLTAQYVG